MKLLLSVATAVTIVAISLLLLMTPIWTHFALEASGGSNATATPFMAFDVTDHTVAEFFLGPGTFEPFGPDEAAHLRDVRLVLLVFLVLAGTCLAFLVGAIAERPRDPERWRAIGRGGAGLVVGTIGLGVLGLIAFDLAFELFHRILFPGGNWAFTTGWLIRLYPEPFWQLSGGALGILAIVGGLLAWFLARRRARALEAARA